MIFSLAGSNNLFYEVLMVRFLRTLSRTKYGYMSVSIPQEAPVHIGLYEGDKVVLDVENGQIIIKKFEV
jgi:hypothetical protein